MLHILLNIWVSKMDQKTYDDFQAICRRNKWKCTSQRIAVYEYIHNNYTHPNVDDVWVHVKQTLPAITRESVYRILNELAERGVIQRLDHLESARYDSKTGPQGHFICIKCGEISDFDFPEAILSSTKSHGNEIRHIELRLSGICDKCKETATGK